MKFTARWFNILLLALAGGCASVKQPDGTTVYRVDADKVDSIIDGNVPGVVRKVVSIYGDKGRAIVIDIKAGVCGLVDSGKVTPDDLQNVLRQAKFLNPDISSEDGELVANAILTTYRIFFEDAVKNGLSADERVAQFIPILEHLCDAVGSGLGGLPPHTFMERQDAIYGTAVHNAMPGVCITTDL